MNFNSYAAETIAREKRKEARRQAETYRRKVGNDNSVGNRQPLTQIVRSVAAYIAVLITG